MSFQIGKRFWPEELQALAPVILFLALIILPINLWGQSDLSLWGYVTDQETGLPIAGAIIELKPGGEIANTDQNGRFTFYYLRQNRIGLTAKSDGYRSANFEDISLETDRSNRLNIVLRKIVFQGEDQIVVAERVRGLLGLITIRMDQPEFKEVRNLSEILRFCPGVILTSTGGTNQTAAVSIAGAPAEQTGIFLDGLPLNSQVTGDFDINSIPKESVDRIEIYSAGAGGELGVGPLAGAVNIITRKVALNSEIGVKQYLGSFDAGGTDLSIQGSFRDKISGLAVFSRNTAANDFEYDDPKLGRVKRENNCRDMDNLFLNLRYRLNRGDIALAFSELSSHSGLPGATYALTYLARKSELWCRWIINSYFLLSSKAKINLTFQHYLSHQQFADQSAFLPYETKYRDDRVSLILNPEYRISLDHLVTLRAEFYSDHFRQTNLLSSNRVPLNVAEQRLQLGLNYDGNIALRDRLPSFELLGFHASMTQTASELFAPLFSPFIRVDLEKGRKNRLVISSSYGSSYRAPTFSSLFWNEDAFSVGNPKLRPEKSEDFIVGGHLLLKWNGGWDLGTEYQNSFVKDLIYWERNFDGKYIPYNMSSARIRTARWNLDWQFPNDRGRLSLAYSLSDPRDRSWETNHHDQILTFRPRKMLDLGYFQRFGFLAFDLKSRWVSERFSRRANTKSLSAYAVTDLNIGLTKRLKKFEISLRGEIDNLFSERYEIIERYPLPGRNYAFNFGLKYF